MTELQDNHRVIQERYHIGIVCRGCGKTSRGLPRCKSCKTVFSEHICIDCGFVWYCPVRRYEPHTLWNHKYCPWCNSKHSREESLVENPTSGFTFRRTSHE